jgi:hypothetical protein
MIFCSTVGDIYSRNVAPEALQFVAISRPYKLQHGNLHNVIESVLFVINCLTEKHYGMH